MRKRITNEHLVKILKSNNEELGYLIKAGFDGVDKRFDGVDARFDVVESRLSSLETGQEDIKADKFEIDDLKNRVGKLEEKHH